MISRLLQNQSPVEAVSRTNNKKLMEKREKIWRAHSPAIIDNKSITEVVEW